ncbi:MAG: tetratricopeptide repeat protein [Bacteroidaceae bacterium]|nr:tetratricopeptide repeat protein [Bacteroidaceae bacterium]
MLKHLLALLAFLCAAASPAQHLGLQGKPLNSSENTIDSLITTANESADLGNFEDAVEQLNMALRLLKYNNRRVIHHTITTHLTQVDSLRSALSREDMHVRMRDLEIDRLNAMHKTMEMRKEELTLRTKAQQEDLIRQSQEQKINDGKKAQLQRQREEMLEKMRKQGRTLFRFMMLAFITMLAFLCFITYYVVNMVREKRLHRIAIDAYHEANRLDKMKTMFLQNLNHEIRAPLASIISFSSLLGEDIDLTEKERKKIHDTMVSNTELLLTLLGDVMDLSTLQSGNYKLDYTQCSLRKLCTSSIETMKSKAQPGVQMIEDFETEDILINTDNKRLLQVLINLISNACKYTEKGSITVAYRRLEGTDRVQLSVTDTGIGIPPEKAKDIFNRFETLGSVKKGYGLGLSICQSVIALMRGTIYLDEKHTHGARFVVELPIDPQEHPETTSTSKMIACSLMCMLLPCAIHAQNNIYRINDTAYDYLNRSLEISSPPQSIVYLDSAAEHCERAGDSRSKGIISAFYTYIYAISGDEKEAKDAHQDVVELTNNTTDKTALFISWNHLIGHYITRNKHLAALSELSDYRERALETNNKYGIAHAYRLMGDYYQNIRLYDLAIDEYEKAVEQSLKVTDNLDIFGIYCHLSETYDKMGNPAKAQEYAQRAFDSCKEELQQVRPLLLLTQLNLKENRLGQAYININRLDSINSKNIIIKSYAQKIVFLKGLYALQTGNIHRVQEIIDRIQTDDASATELQMELNKFNRNYYDIYLHLIREVSNEDSVFHEINRINYNDYVMNLSFQKDLLEAKKDQEHLQVKELDVARSNEELTRLGFTQDSLKEKINALELKNVRDLNNLYTLELERKKGEQKQLEQKQQDEEAYRMEVTFYMTFLIILMASGTYFVYKQRRRTQYLLGEAEENMHNAEEANRLKTRFLQDMNHEIRTPLNGILGFCDLLAEADNYGMSNEEKASMVENIQTLGTRLQQLVDDILDMSKLESGTYHFTQQPLQLRELAAETETFMRDLVAPGVSYRFIVDENLPTVVTDRVRLKQLIIKLLENAARFTQEGYIQTHWRMPRQEPTRVWLRVEVTDTGCGIAEGQEETIFNRFMKLNQFDNGFGLGLSICRVIATQMGGTIWAEKGLQQGAQFVVELPLNISAESAATPAETK